LLRMIEGNWGQRGKLRLSSPDGIRNLLILNGG
jgi:hypothetical protein